MRKLLFIIATSSSALLVACGNYSEKNANREYVKAATRVVAAEKAFNAADYSTALQECLAAKGEVEKIVNDYPDTSLSLKIVSDGTMRIGSCKFIDLRDSIIPRLESFTAPEMKSVELAWAIAVENGSYEEFARALIKNCNKFDANVVAKLLDKSISKVKSITVRGELRSAYLSAMSAKKSSEKTVVSTKPVQKISANKIVDTKAFLRDANSASSLVAYDLNALDKLRDMSKSARFADKDTQSKFASSLSKAYDNVLKISTPSVREKALATMAIAFAYFGDDLRAIAISHKITNEDLFYNVFNAIGENASGGANYKETLTLASRLKDVGERSRFLSSLAIDIAKRGYFDRSREVAAMVPDVLLKNAAYAGAAKIAFDAGKFQEAAACVSLLNVKNLDCLAIFDETKIDPQSATASRLASLASKLAAHNAKLAGALNNLALSSLNSMQSHNEASGYVFRMVFDNFVKLDNTDVALNFVLNNVHRVNPSIFKESVCALAINSKNRELSKKAYSLLSDIYKADNSIIEFAVLLAANGVSREESVEILADVLPKFAK